MFLFKRTEGTSEFAAEGKKFTEIINELNDALKTGLDPDILIETLTGAEGAALKLQRSLGGVVTNASAFRETMIGALAQTKSIGGSFAEVKDSIEGVSSAMGKMVMLSEKQKKIQRDGKEITVSELEYMVQFSKATGMATKEVGSMVGELSRFGGTMLENINYMSELALSARKSGLDAKAYTTEVGKNMKMASGFGFKAGKEGIEKMVKQASVLRTTIDSIGAKGFADKLLDPEGAIEAAANMQMLGGAVGKLADPFQLMHMAQSDMEGLQKELVNSTKAAFSFNKATGGFDASTEDLYRLRRQAEITGQDFNNLLEQGKEAAKMDFLKNTLGLDSFDEDKQNLIGGLAQIGKGGKVSIDIPGLERQEFDNQEELKKYLQRGDVTKALKDYQDQAGKTEKELALEQMTVSEQQAADVKEIKEFVFMNLSKAERDKYIQNLKKEGGEARDAYKKVAAVGQSTVQSLATSGITGIGQKATEVKYEAGIEPEDISKKEELKRKLEGGLSLGTGTSDSRYTQPDIQRANDLFAPSGGIPRVMAAGKIYEGIVGDEVAMGTNLSKAFNQLGSSLSGKLDININVGGSVGGDSGNVAKMFEDPAVQKKIMDTVLYKLEMYKKQKGVLA